MARKQSMQTSIVGRKQTRLSENGSGWWKEPRRHREAALRGQRRAASDGQQVKPEKIERFSRASAARSTSAATRPEPTPAKDRYADLRAPPSSAELPKFVDGWPKKDGRDVPHIERWDSEDGFIVAGPAYENHKRGRNWLATIDTDPTAPGGLKRDFVDRGKGRYMYRNQLDVGDAFEVGADYYTGGGSKNSNREYGVIIEKHGGTVQVLRFKEPEDAIKFSREMRSAIKWAESN